MVASCNCRASSASHPGGVVSAAAEAVAVARAHGVRSTGLSGEEDADSESHSDGGSDSSSVPGRQCGSEVVRCGGLGGVLRGPGWLSHPSTGHRSVLRCDNGVCGRTVGVVGMDRLTVGIEGAISIQIGGGAALRGWNTEGADRPVQGDRIFGKVDSDGCACSKRCEWDAGLSSISHCNLSFRYNFLGVTFCKDRSGLRPSLWDVSFDRADSDFFLVFWRSAGLHIEHGGSRDCSIPLFSTVLDGERLYKSASVLQSFHCEFRVKES